MRLRENAQRIDDVIAQLEPVFAAFLTSPQGQKISSGNETRAILEQSDFTDQYFLTLMDNSKREEMIMAVSVGGAVRLQSSTADGVIERETFISGIGADEAAAHILGWLMDADGESSLLHGLSDFLRQAIGYQKTTCGHDPAPRTPPEPC